MDQLFLPLDGTQLELDIPGPGPLAARSGRFPQRGMSGPHLPVAITDDWLTPPGLLKRLGPFDLDPCASVTQPWPTAARMLTIRDNGLRAEWRGRCFVNPPYGREAATWLARLANHGNGIALVFARTETAMFFDHVWYRATALLFLRGRLTFHRPDGELGDFNGGAPSVLIAYGDENARCLAGLNDLGRYVPLDIDHPRA